MHISEFSTEQLYVAIQRRARAIMEDAGLTVDDLFMNNVVSHTHVRNAKIRTEYAEQVAAGVKGEAILAELMQKYGLSYGQVKKIVNNQR